MKVKNRVLKLVKMNLGLAIENLHRATNSFSKLTEKELNSEYGESGRTCKEILDEYKVEVSKAKKNVKWINSKQI